LFDNSTIVVLVIGIMLLGYQILVTYLVKRCKFFEPRQRVIQWLLIWLLPMFGALICHAVISALGSQRNLNNSLIKHYGQDKVDEYLGAHRRPSHPENVSLDDADGDG